MSQKITVTRIKFTIHWMDPVDPVNPGCQYVSVLFFGS